MQIAKYSLKGFVIGIPFDKHQVSSDVSPISLTIHVPCIYCFSSTLTFFSTFCQAMQVKVFIDNLCRTKMLEGVKYTYWNESFTSKVD